MPALDIADCINETCPWSGKPVQADSLTEYDGQVVGFCSPGCRDQFETAIRHFDQAKRSGRVRLKTFKGRGVQPGVDLDDGSSLLDLTDQDAGPS